MTQNIDHIQHIYRTKTDDFYISLQSDPTKYYAKTGESVEIVFIILDEFADFSVVRIEEVLDNDYFIKEFDKLKLGSGYAYVPIHLYRELLVYLKPFIRVF